MQGSWPSPHDQSKQYTSSPPSADPLGAAHPGRNRGSQRVGQSVSTRCVDGRIPHSPRQSLSHGQPGHLQGGSAAFVRSFFCLVRRCSPEWCLVMRFGVFECCAHPLSHAEATVHAPRKYQHHCAVIGYQPCAVIGHQPPVYPAAAAQRQSHILRLMLGA